MTELDRFMIIIVPIIVVMLISMGATQIEANNEKVIEYCYRADYWDGEHWTFKGVEGENGFIIIWKTKAECEQYKGDWELVVEHNDHLQTNYPRGGSGSAGDELF